MFATVTGHGRGGEILQQLRGAQCSSSLRVAIYMYDTRRVQALSLDIVICRPLQNQVSLERCLMVLSEVIHLYVGVGKGTAGVDLQCPPGSRRNP